MPALNFLERFESDIRAGWKRQTCRRTRARPIVAGDKLFLYVGMRTKACRLIVKTTCLRAERVLLTRKTLRVDGARRYDLDSFARCDGFESWREFVDTVERLYGLPFKGSAITWMHLPLPINPQ